jgi:hypothetical protein
MSPRLAILALVAAGLAPAADAQVLMSKQCETMWQGHPIRGMVQIERQIYYDTHRVYGNFRDDQGNLIEFEIMTNQPQGVGGMWFNNARHRELHVRWQMLPDGGFVITGENGAAARYTCR